MSIHQDLPAAVPANQPRSTVLLSVNDVCVTLQCGRTFVYELLQKGELRAIKLGRLTRISRAVLDEFIARNEVSTIEWLIDDRRGVSDHREPLSGQMRVREQPATRRRATAGNAGRGDSAQQQWLLDADAR